MPITVTPPKDEPEAEPVIVTEEEYRAKMEDEIRRDILEKMEASKRKSKKKKTVSEGGDRHQFSLRLSPDVFKRLQEAAEFESRSITNLIITYLELVYTIPTWELRQILDDYNGRRSRRKQR